MENLFQFEQDKYYALRRIPMAIRRKLDLCGVKLTIRDWSKFSRPDREQLLAMPCDDDAQIAAFGLRLKSLIEACGGDSALAVPIDPEPAWKITSTIPAAVCARIVEQSLPAPTLEQWAALSELQRFALTKLTREGHDNKNLPHALQEFGLVPSTCVAAQRET